MWKQTRCIVSLLYTYSTVSNVFHKQIEEVVIRNLGNLCSISDSAADAGQGSCFFKKLKLGFDFQGKLQVFTSSDKFYCKFDQNP